MVDLDFASTTEEPILAVLQGGHLFLQAMIMMLLLMSMVSLWFGLDSLLSLTLIVKLLVIL